MVLKEEPARPSVAKVRLSLEMAESVRQVAGRAGQTPEELIRAVLLERLGKVKA